MSIEINVSDEMIEMIKTNGIVKLNFILLLYYFFGDNSLVFR